MSASSYSTSAAARPTSRSSRSTGSYFTSFAAAIVLSGAVHTSTIPVGGNILTNDIALGLKTSTFEAETIKRTIASASADDREGGDFFVKTLDGRSTRPVTRAQLRSIVAPRILEIFRMAKAQIAERIPRDVVLAEVVLTGGGAHLYGIERAAAEFFGMPARIGVPTAIGGLTDAVKKPEFATAVGLVLFGPRGDGATWHASSRTIFGKIALWFGDLWN